MSREGTRESRETGKVCGKKKVCVLQSSREDKYHSEKFCSERRENDGSHEVQRGTSLQEGEKVVSYNFRLEDPS